MTRRPVEMTILSLYLLIVFSLSAVGSLFGAAKALGPYTTVEWLLLMVPKLIAIAAGIALWRMFRIGAWLCLAAAVLGWANAILLRTGFFPSFTVATLVAVAIYGFAIWAITRNWRFLKPLRPASDEQSEVAR